MKDTVKKQTFKIENITPKAAAIMLSNNPGNRKISPVHVKFLARAMTRGEWMVTGQGLTVSQHDELLDGQHRLHAIIQSGCTIPMLVIRGVSRDAMDVIDTGGKGRTHADILTMHDVPNAVVVAAAIKVMHGFSFGGMYGKMYFSEVKLTAGQVLEYLDLFPAIQKHAKNAVGWYSTCDIQGSVLAALGLIFQLSERKKGDAHNFMTGVGAGELLSKDDPEYLLRRRIRLLRTDAHGSTRPRQELVINYFLRAWNANYEGKKMKILMIQNPKIYPLVNGFDATVLPFYKDHAPSKK